MKRIFTKIILILCLCFMVSFKAYAVNSLNINPSINGTIEKGKQIEITINIDDIKSLYAASVYFKYDPKILKIDEIIPGNLISDSKISKFEAIKNIDENKGIASYGFTCMGDINGFAGKGNLLKLKATVLDNKDFKLTSNFGNSTPDDKNTIAIQICDKNIEELPYNFKNFTYTAPKNEKTSTSNSDKVSGAGDDNDIDNSNSLNNNEIKGNEQSSTENKGENSISNNVKEEKKASEAPVTKTTNNANRNITFILGSIVFVCLLGFGYYKFLKGKK